MGNYFDQFDGPDSATTEFEPARQNYFDQFDDSTYEQRSQQTAQQQTGATGDDPEWADYGKMVMAGGAQIGSGIGWLFDSFDWGESLKQAGNDAHRHRAYEVYGRGVDGHSGQQCAHGRGNQ